MAFQNPVKIPADLMTEAMVEGRVQSLSSSAVVALAEASINTARPMVGRKTFAEALKIVDREEYDRLVDEVLERFYELDLDPMDAPDGYDSIDKSGIFIPLAEHASLVETTALCAVHDPKLGTTELVREEWTPIDGDYTFAAGKTVAEIDAFFRREEKGS